MCVCVERKCQANYSFQANKYEQVLARRAQGISENLHKALARHKRLVTDDITSALIEHARSSIMYERQHLRELEALRVDVANAAKKVAPAPISAPRPAFIPKLEEFSRPPIPRPASGPPVSAPNTSIRPNFGPTNTNPPAPISPIVPSAQPTKALSTLR